MQNNLRVEKMTEIIKRNSDCVYRLAFSMVKTNQDAEDIRQEVMLRYIRTNPIFENREQDKAYFQIDLMSTDGSFDIDRMEFSVHQLLTDCESFAGEILKRQTDI